MEIKCDLCKGPETRIEEDHVYYWVAYCRTCKDSQGNPVLMAWSKEHIMPHDKHSKTVYDLMVVALMDVSEIIYGAGNFQLDFNQRAIPDHMHIHSRPSKRKENSDAESA